MSETNREETIRELKSFPVSCLDFKEQKALNRAISDMQKLEKIELNLEHIDIAIRCAMCTNTMANDRGCDGGCRIDEDMYKKVMSVIDKDIEQIIRGGNNEID